jgi:hypothetical protein
MSIEDETREPTLAYIAKLETRIGVLELALRNAARRFNMMGDGFVNGINPQVGYRECIIALVEAERDK